MIATKIHHETRIDSKYIFVIVVKMQRLLKTFYFCEYNDITYRDLIPLTTLYRAWQCFQ